MPISVKCGDCAYDFKVADEHAGKKIRCPTCRGIVQVGRGAASPPAQVKKKSSPKANRSSKSGRTAAPKAKATAASPPPRRARKRTASKKSGGNNAAIMGAGIGIGAVLLIGLPVVYFLTRPPASTPVPTTSTSVETAETNTQDDNDASANIPGPESRFY